MKMHDRNTAPIATVLVDEQTIYSAELMGMDKIDATFDLPSGYDYRDAGVLGKWLVKE